MNKIARLLSVALLLLSVSVSVAAHAALASISLSVSTTPVQVSATGTGYTDAIQFQNQGAVALFLVKNNYTSDPAPSAATCLTGFSLPAGATIAKEDPNGTDLSTMYACAASGSTTLAVFP